MKTTNVLKLTSIAILSAQLLGCAHHSPQTLNDKVEEEKVVINIDIKTKYDEFKDITDSYTHSEKSSYGLLGYDLDLMPEWGVTTSGKEKINEKSRIYGLIKSTSTSWIFGTCNDLVLLIDGERYVPSSIRHDGLVNSSTRNLHVQEYITYDMDYKLASRIASAKTVRGQLCGVQFELSQDNKNALKRLIDKSTK